MRQVTHYLPTGFSGVGSKFVQILSIFIHTLLILYMRMRIWAFYKFLVKSVKFYAIVFAIFASDE